MRYRIKKNQLFRKKLEMPDRILDMIYNNELSFQDYMEYDLSDKVPVSCLKEIHRKIVEKFGIERSKDVDWELIDLKGYVLISTIDDISDDAKDINEELYKFARNDMLPKDYTAMMRKTFDSFVLDNEELEISIRNSFNSGTLEINKLVKIWKYIKNKQLTLCLKNDKHNKYNITEDELKKFMDEYDGLLSLLDDSDEIYDLINTIYHKETKEDTNEYIKSVVEKILEKSIATEDKEAIELSGEQYKVIFRYTSIKDYLYKKIGEDRAESIIKQLNGKDPSYLVEIPIPFNVLIEDDVLSTIEIYGLDNIVNFDEECGSYFTNNDCKKLRELYPLYIKNGANEVDKDKSIFTKNPYGITGNYIERGYTKEEFYEAIRRMIVFGPTDEKYSNKANDYSDISGEFREMNPELFIDKNAPEEFQNAFYTKTLTPIFVRNHYNCISYLIGKKISSIFIPLKVRISTSEDGYYYKHENIYKFLEEKLGFEDTIRIITEYADVFEILFGSYEKISQKVYVAPIQFNPDDKLKDIINKINDKLYELIIKANIKYSSNLSKSMKEKYPDVFISYRASQDLHDKFYNRDIDAKYIINHPQEKKYFEGLDVELFFNYMPIVLVSDDGKSKRIENLILFVKNLFGNEEGLSILLSYHYYLDKVNEKLGFSKVEFRETITTEEFLVQIDCLIYLNIIRGEILYDDNMPSHFKAAYPSLFLLDSTPEDIKHNFYNRLFNIDDFVDNPVLLKYFSNTDIACCLDTTFSYMIGLFNSNDFLEVIKICGESIKSETKLFNYIRSKTEDMLTAHSLGKYLFEYFEENEQTLKYLLLLQKLGVDNKKVRELLDKFSKVITVRDDLDIYSTTMSTKIISDSVIKDYGYDVINSVLKYNTGAHKVLINSIENKDGELKQWIHYLKSLPIYSEIVLHLALVSYDNMKNIIKNILNDNVSLDEEGLLNLRQVLIDNNKYEVNTVNELNNYEKHVKKNIDNKIKSANINVVREGILERLFNTSLQYTKDLFDKYGLNSVEYTNLYILKSNILSLEDEAILTIIREVLTADDTEELKEQFKDIVDFGIVRDSLDSIDCKLKKYYGKELRLSLSNFDENSSDVNYSNVPNVETNNILNIKDNYVTRDKEVKVIELNGVKFNLLVYCVPKVDDYFDKGIDLFNNSSMWNRISNSVLPMNLISNKHLGCFNHGDKNQVYYGFNNISDNSLEFMSRRDINIEYNPVTLKVIDNNSEYMIPSMLNLVSTSYNTIGINIDTNNSSEYSGRIQPSCIVCFDGEINDNSIIAATYFDIPIYMINKDKYNLKNEGLIQKYEDKDYMFNKNDVEELFCIRNLSLKQKYKILLENRKYTDDIKKVMCAYSIHNDISSIDLNELEEGVANENKE